jgi:hypothetical protein
MFCVLGALGSAAEVTVQVDPNVQGVPLTVIAGLARAALGIGDAETPSDGVVVGLITAGTNHVGHEPAGAANVLTPVPTPLNVHVVPAQDTPAPVKVKSPPTVLIVATPEPVPLNVQVVPAHETPAPVKVNAPGLALMLDTPPVPEMQVLVPGA